MELSNQKKLTKHIFRLLKVHEIVIPIGRTNKGNLGIKFSQNSEDYEIMLDSIPLSTKDFLADDNNIELKKMLDKYLFEEPTFAQKVTENYRQDIEDNVMNSLTIEGKNELNETGVIPTTTMVKRRGRPAGSKNAPKPAVIDTPVESVPVVEEINNNVN